MKLHLPKMLLTAVLAACVAPATWAADYDLLASDSKWTVDCFQGGRARLPKYHAATEGTAAYFETQNWGQALASYEERGSQRGCFVVGEDNTFTFTATLASGNPNSSVLGISLAGDSQAIAYGTLKYSTTDISYAITNTVGDVYLADSTNWGGDYIKESSVTGTKVGIRTSDSYTLSGIVRLDGSNYMLDLFLNGTKVTDTSVNLGTKFNVSCITLQADGGTNRLTDLKVSGGYESIRFDTEVSGSVSIADASWSKNGSEYATSDFSLTDGTTNLGMSGAGEGATMVFDSDVSVAAIDVTSGAVTLQNTGSITTQELCVVDGAVAYLDSNSTIKQAFGKGKITINEATSGNRIVTIRNVNAYSGCVTVNGANSTLNLGNSYGIMSDLDLIINAGKLVIDGSNDNATAASDAQKIGSLTVGAAEVDITDGSYNFAEGISVVSGKVATIINSWDKNQFAAGLNGDSTTALKLSRRNRSGEGNNYRTLVLTAAGDFSGKISLINNNGPNNNYNHGITVTSAATGALKNAVVDFSTDGNGSVLVFSDTVDNPNGTMLDGAVGGLSGEKGRVYAKGLTIDTAAKKEYIYSGTITAESLTISGAGKQTLTQSYSGDVNVTGGNLVLAHKENNETTIKSFANAIQGELNITNGAVTAYHHTDADDSVIGKDTAVNINTGGTLNLKGRDMLGWVGGPAITLCSNDLKKKATLNIEDSVSNTFSSIVTMNGNAQITGNKINTHGTSFTVSGKGNEVSVDTIEIRKAWAIQVKDEGDELTLASQLVIHSDNKGDNKTVSDITKSGAGKLIITGKSTEWSGSMMVNAGALQLQEEASLGLATIVMGTGTTLETGTGTITNLTLNEGSKLSADTAVSMDGTLTLGGPITLDGALLDDVLSLKGGTVTLFTNVSSLVLGNVTWTKGALDENTGIALENWFSLTSQEEAVLLSSSAPTNGSAYYLGYNAAGAVYVGMVIPEPTTATLSLLALAGLAARRRRK